MTIPMPRAMHVVVAWDIVEVTTVRNKRRPVVVQMTGVVPCAVSSDAMVATIARVPVVT